MIRHLLAPVAPSAAAALALPRRCRAPPASRSRSTTARTPRERPAILEVLARAGARATFFVIGEQVRRRPQLVAEIAAAGHQVALHGDRHRLQLRVGATAIADDVARGRAAVEDAISRSPVWHRPPYGIYSPAGLRAAQSAGLRPLLWSRWGKDWRRLTTPSRIAARVLHGVLPGDVILLHDADFYSSRGSHRRTTAALALILSELDRRKVGTVLPV